MDTASVLITTAIGLGVVHTALGVDHTVPFVVMAKARGWGLVKTLRLTFLCGIAHLLSSVLLGAIGIALGVGLSSLEAIESFRGEIAAWGLIFFGLTYAAWGWRRSHRHLDVSRSRTPSLALFIIFVLGPCETLIPMLMAPAYARDWSLVGIVALAFSVATLGTMLSLVTALSFGLKWVPDHALRRHGHTLAGLSVAGSGLAIRFLGI